MAFIKLAPVYPETDKVVKALAAARRLGHHDDGCVDCTEAEPTNDPPAE